MTYKCEKDIDCPYWMACELGICKYTKCSQQNPCSPGLICEQEFSSQLEISHVLNGTTHENQHRNRGPKSAVVAEMRLLSMG